MELKSWIERPPVVRAQTLTTILIVAACATVWLPMSIPVAGLNIRASQLVLLALIVILMPQASWRITPRGAAAILCAVVFLGSLAFWTTWWHESLPAKAPGRVLLHGINLLHWAILQTLLWRSRALRSAMLTLITTVAAFDAFYIAVAALAAVGVSVPLPILVTVEQETLVNGVRAVQTVQRFEGGGITAGVLSAACLLMMLPYMMDMPERRPKRWLLTCALLCAGIVLGYSRQSLVSLAAGGMVIAGGFALRGQAKPILRTGLRLLGAGALTALILTILPPTRVYMQAYAARADQLLSAAEYSSGTANERLQMWSDMLGDVAQNPFIGQGQDSYLRHYPPDDPTQTKHGEGAHNFWIEALHAGGLFALLALIALHILAFWPLVVRVLAGARAQLPVAIALAAAGAAVLASTLTNLIYWNPTYWVFLALVSSIGVEYDRQSADA
jgi:O-antigen ligase